MLTELYIKNFAIVDELRVQWGAGLNVLTGETGAGKSIIVDALGAALGQRVGAEVVRTGSAQALVEAVFDLPESGGEDGQLGSLLADHGIDLEDGLIILGREVNRATGRTAARINGRTVPLSLLQQLGQLLVDIHGQSEHLSLLRVREHVEYLDRYAGLLDLRERVGQAVRELRSVRDSLEQMSRDEREAARELDLLSYQIQEIRASSPVEGEEEELEAERLRLRNSERLRELAHGAYSLLFGGDEQSGAVDLLAQADRIFIELTRLDESLEPDRQALESARYAIEEVAERARDYADTVEDDPERLNEVEERIDLLARLRRKYGHTLADVLKYCEESEERLERLSNRAFYMDELRQRETALVAMVGSLASELSAGRRAVAVQLARDVEAELAGLNMKGTSFTVDFSLSADPAGVPYRPGGDGTAAGEAGDSLVAFDTSGVDRVEFLVSPNPGEAPKPLARIASGGEMARLMLALKSILSKADSIPTLVFDEIDVGVGARSGTRVGEKLWTLTKGHQVLCITHMPQIACMADLHLSVMKQVNAGRTRTAVAELDHDQRVKELAAMLAGTSELASAVASAEDLIAKAEEWKTCKA